MSTGNLSARSEFRALFAAAKSMKREIDEAARNRPAPPPETFRSPPPPEASARGKDMAMEEWRNTMELEAHMAENGPECCTCGHLVVLGPARYCREHRIELQTDDDGKPRPCAACEVQS